MLSNPTLIGLQASLQRLEDNIKAGHDSVNLEIQRIHACNDNRVFYDQQLRRCRQQLEDLMCENWFLGQLVCMNGDEINAVRRRMIDLESSLDEEIKNQEAADKKISSILHEIEKMRAERDTISDTIKSLEEAEAVSSPLEYDDEEVTNKMDTMDLDGVGKC